MPTKDEQPKDGSCSLVVGRLASVSQVCRQKHVRPAGFAMYGNEAGRVSSMDVATLYDTAV